MGVPRGQEPDGGAGHRAEHAGAPHDTGERAGGQEDARHQECRRRVRVDPGALEGRAGIVDDQRQGDPGHEPHDGLERPRHHRPHQDDRQGEIDPEEPRPPEAPFRLGQFAPGGRGLFEASRQPEPTRLASAEPIGDREDVGQADRLHRDQGAEQLGRGDAQGRRGPDHGARPGEEVHARGQRGDAGEDAPVHPEPLVHREHRRDRDQERHRPGAVEVDQQGQQRRPGDDPRRPAAGGAEDAVDDRVEQAGVGHDAEVEDREDEHARHRGDLADPADDEGPGLRPEAAQERGGRRDRDQRDQRRHPTGEDGRQQRQDRQQAQGREHRVVRLRRLGGTPGRPGYYRSTSLASAPATMRSRSSGRRNPARRRASAASRTAAT